MYEDFIGSLDHPSHSSESGRPSREEYNATYGGYPAMPRYRFGDMSPAWKSAAEQTVNSLQPADDFATPDHGAAESSALTANSISDTHDELDVDHEFDGDLPGDLFDMNSGNVEDQQMDEEVSIIEYDDDDDEQMNEMVSHTSLLCCELCGLTLLPARRIVPPCRKSDTKSSRRLPLQSGTAHGSHSKPLHAAC